MAVNDIYRVTIQGTLHGSVINSVLHYREGASGGTNGQAILAGLIDAEFAANVLSVLSNEFAYTGTLCQKASDTTPPLATLVSTSAGSGGVAQNSLPSGVSAVIKKKTALAGPRYRGRIFQAGIPATYELDSLVTGAGQAALLAAWANMIGPHSSGAYSFTMCLYDKAAALVSLVTQVGMDTPLRQQRRRQVGRGV